MHAYEVRDRRHLPTAHPGASRIPYCRTALHPGGRPLGLGGRIRNRLFGVSARETQFARRGFEARTSTIQEHLESHARTFLDGYHAALQTPEPVALERALERIDADRRGFAYEGAAMALTLLDRLTPWKHNRWRTFRDGPGDPHAYMMHVGAGWALVRLRVRPTSMLHGFDPLLRWLVLDGAGFHQGFFATNRTIDGRDLPHAYSGYTARAFDQGIGRSLWFSQGADPERIGTTIRRFATTRHADLWSGIGLAATYAGGVDTAAMRLLLHEARGFETEVGQGCCFAAKARLRAGNLVPHTQAACEVLLGCTAEAAAALSDDALGVALNNLRRLETTSGADPARTPAYELWRQEIRGQIQMQGVKA